MYIGIVSDAYRFLEYYKNPYSLTLKQGDKVIVEDATKEYVFAVVSSCVTVLPSFVNKDSLLNIVRIATVEDKKNNAQGKALASEARAFCSATIKTLLLDMKIVHVECLLDLKKIFFYFTAEERIDFRELVKVLVEKYRKRIELRQITARYETQLLGSLGNCGRESCCSSHIRTFKPVNVRMAKEQNIFLSPTKTSGICGRLLCCLEYEQSSYEYFKEIAPQVGKKYLTKLGKVFIVKVNSSTKTIEFRKEDNEIDNILFSVWEDFCISKI